MPLTAFVKFNKITSEKDSVRAGYIYVDDS